MDYTKLQGLVVSGLMISLIGFVSSANSHAFASFKVTNQPNQSPPTTKRNAFRDHDESTTLTTTRYQCRFLLRPVLDSKQKSYLGSAMKNKHHHHTYALSALQAISTFLDEDDIDIPFQQNTQIYRRRPMIAGNWKLNPSTISEAVTLLKLISANFINHNRASCNSDSDDGVDVVIFPPFPFLTTAISLLDGTGIKVGAQNCGLQTKGAFTGEVSPSILASIGCEYVMLGHSERRVLFKENDDDINIKVKLCLAEGKTNASGRLNVILCVGETEEEYNNDLLVSVVDVQVKKGLAGVSKEDMDRITIA